MSNHDDDGGDDEKRRRQKNKQDDSDPLPYTQIDRAVAPKVALLASKMKASTQHAKGSLIDFWELNGDPRELEKLVLAGKTEVVIDRNEVQRRFDLASGGYVVEPEVLVTLGLLEPRNDLFRVRGMSRFFEPILKRNRSAATASAAGKASAAAREKKFGSAVPLNARNGIGDGSTAAEHSTEQPTEQTTEHDRTLAGSDQRSAGSKKKKKKEAQGELPEMPEPVVPPRQQSEQELAYELYQLNRRYHLEQKMNPPCYEEDEKHNPAYVNTALGKILDACRRDEPDVDALQTFERLTDLWWDNQWGSGLKPPFPFKAFASLKIWPKLLEKVTGVEAPKE